ncbi:DNA circularization N-terminal domain-containing protein [Rhodocyclus gracilis]|nr:DNA circularization N-terminal domain-containing protein [Rhodocyclus gracilis]
MSRASLRGFEFLTDSHDAKGGRRLVVHEYPGKDEPNVQDMGGKSWDWRLNAYFIGPDYDLERNGFLVKLAEPGAAWLTHPWLGLLWVRVHTWSVHESTDKGGYCTIAIEFVPGGETIQPVPDRVDVAFDRTRQLADAAVDDFSLEPMSADGMTAFIAAVQQKLEVLRQAISLATLPLTWASQIMGLIDGVKGDLATLMGMPAAYASALRSLSQVLGGGADSSGLSDTERPRVVAGIAGAAMNKSTTTLTGAAAADGAVRRNLLREDALRSRLLVTAAAQVAMADYRAEADRDAALESVLSAIDALLPSLPDPVFQAAAATRAALYEALLAQDLKPAAYRDVTVALPAVVLAHRLGVDEAVFLARNAVRHPLFVKGRVYG